MKPNIVLKNMFTNGICANQQRPMYLTESTLPKFWLLSILIIYFMPTICSDLHSKHKVSFFRAYVKISILFSRTIQAWNEHITRFLYVYILSSFSNLDQEPFGKNHA